MPLPALIAGAARAVGTASAGAELFGASSAASSLGQLSQALHLTGSTASAITPSFDKLTSGMTFFIRAIENAAKPIEALVRVANPAQANAFNRAMQDAYGVIGRSLIPVMQAFTRVARQIGDVMAGLEPTFKPAIAAIAKLVDVTGKELKNAIITNIGLFEVLADVLLVVANNTATWIKALGFGANIAGFNSAAGMAGYRGHSFDPDGTSRGAAARHASFMQPKQLSDDMIKNALMQGIGRKSTEGYLADITKQISEIMKVIEKKYRQDKAVKEANTVGNPANSLDTRWGLTAVGQ